ncbi:hypothetical protein NX02_29560 [Sphingomonas sanxanigenens DSM 19645 = NX02]|uniref:Uncharacterized protein n=1 Tax=Sphingomonas sanxanigenens DSM 19645 = NX02 TaxID=1123269 RepID=W0APD3_9SPHN|nr:hypothetical protein NX02_29560 [Sphingomonas sanxanigenens DSM 19645 = NX02]
MDMVGDFVAILNQFHQLVCLGGVEHAVRHCMSKGSAKFLSLLRVVPRDRRQGFGIGRRDSPRSFGFGNQAAHQLSLPDFARGLPSARPINERN